MASSPRSYRLLALLLLSLLTPSHTHRYSSRVSWINGIAHSPTDAAESATKASQYFNAAVNYCHNPTAMSTPGDVVGYVRDLTQAATQKWGRVTEEVNELKKHLSNLCALCGPKGTVVHLCHSQGSLITSLTLPLLTASERAQVEVVSFGGAAAITSADFPGFKRTVNYYSTNDPLLHCVPLASRALSSGLLTSARGEREFVFLTPVAGDPVADHGFLGPTYKSVVKQEGERYQAVYRGYGVRALDAVEAVNRNAEALVKATLGRMWGHVLLLWRAIVEAFARARQFVIGKRSKETVVEVA
mmetsp:Transcript_8750/g.17556  ORF Transcript_8750/g.17556 Transcript_8750/m.17556 type:complete len:301 (-) Transcript_8750:1222-2124(-)